jgi:hypothetical protein
VHARNPKALTSNDTSEKLPVSTTPHTRPLPSTVTAFSALGCDRDAGHRKLHADDSDSSHVDKPERKPHAACTATRTVSSVPGCVR